MHRKRELKHPLQIVRGKASGVSRAATTLSFFYLAGILSWRDPLIAQRRLVDSR